MTPAICVLLLGSAVGFPDPEPPKPKPKVPTAVSPDKQLTATATNKTIVVKDSQTGKLIRSIRAHTDEVVSLAYAPDGKFLCSGDRGGVINVFDVSTGKALWRHKTDQKGPGALAFSPDGKTVIWTVGQAIRSIDAATGKLLR